jgi:hypothetical protein
MDIKNKGVLNNITISPNDLLVTRHSNLGNISFLYNLIQH